MDDLKYKRGEFISGIDRSYERSIYEVLGYNREKQEYIVSCAYFKQELSLGTYRMKKERAEQEYQIVSAPNMETLKILYGRKEI
jgi:hypothetical protein